ncbi:DTW domain-domain-containing protein [Absidia repens]|uniref:tRNA-uridine aminocarboxypropyltransferase 1 n=1 Tax=Absidia repens TaxID=90262 RepID=A0A1X2IWM8_9FUNG|nr:DTW domain-domain-containing protein [Absidia repens]
MSDLQIADDTVLHKTNERYKCPTCEKPVKYFCYHCFNVVGMDRTQVPTVKLPVHLDVIKHEKEHDGKSTAIHARVLAPEDVSLYGYGQIPTYEQPERTLLLFPGPNAKTLNEIPRESFDRIVVLDGTWRQATRMARDAPQLQGLQQITIAPRKTNFWRFQQKSENHLATIEAIYYTYREYAEAYESEDGTGAYHGQYDNLMFYYRFFYNLIQSRYKNNHTRTFNPRHQKNYIQYDDESGKPGDNNDDTENKRIDDHNSGTPVDKKQKLDTDKDGDTKKLDD